MYKVGLSRSGAALTEESFQNLSNSGIEAIEVAMTADKYTQVNYKELLDFSKRYGVSLWSCHLPFMPFKEIDISSLDRELRENAMRIYTEVIEKAADIGIDKFIVHPSGEPIAEGDREERIKYSMQMLDSLAELAARNGACIAVEDLPRTCLGNTSDEMLSLVGANDKLKVCFDTNHLLTDRNLVFMEKLADKIVTVHISDYDFIDEKHWLPGEGRVDWNELFTTLCKIGYRGVWMYEVGLKSPKTLNRSRDLTFGDFVQNANSIFRGETPLRIY